MIVDSPDASGAVIQVRRAIRAAPARAFEAWTKPDDLRRWWRATPGHTPAEVAIDLRVGGAYRLGMRAADGVVHVVTGAYREISPPRRLVYTWRWVAPGLSPHQSLVTVDFLARGAATEVVITHAGLPAETQPLHAQGWAGCHDALAPVAEGDPP